MTEFVDWFAVAAIPMVGLLTMICIAGGLEYLWEIHQGYEPAPRWMTRRYWKRKAVRVICALARIEAAFEQRKSPRKAATKRGIVGQRVRRSACMYSTIIPQPARDVKGNEQIRVAWNWMRG